MSTDPQSTGAGPAIAAGPAFDPDRGYRASPQVSLRPEPFGALVYHFGTRRLSFLKTPELFAVVSGLAEHPTVHAAIDAGGVEPALELLDQLGLAHAETASLTSCGRATSPSPAGRRS